MAACLHDAATIVVAIELGCEFEDRRLTDDGYKWPTSIFQASKSNTPKAGANAERRFSRPSRRSTKRAARLSLSGTVADLTASTIIPLIFQDWEMAMRRQGRHCLIVAAAPPVSRFSRQGVLPAFEAVAQAATADHSFKRQGLI
jgi:hypothetical protein